MPLGAGIARFDTQTEGADYRFSRLEFIGELLELQKRTYAGKKLFGIERLAKEVVGSGFDPFQTIFTGAEAGDHYDRNETRLRIILQLVA